MAANNETGVVQPLADVMHIARRHGALVHCDAVQAAGRYCGAWQEADLISLSAHKFGGMAGAGALIVRDGVPLAARSRGGGQEYGLRAGTESLATIAAFGAAVTAASGDDCRRLRKLRDDMEARMLDAVPDAVVFSGDARRLDNTLAIAHPEIDAETMVMSFDLDCVAISAGAACSSGRMEPSAVIEAMGFPSLSRHAVRLSLGWSSTAEDCDAAVRAWKAADTRHRTRRAGSAMTPLYLDCNATTPVDPAVVDAMMPWFREQFGNPHSVNHAFGTAAAAAVEDARRSIAHLVGADTREIIFTSGATESNNLAIKGAARFERRMRGSPQPDHHRGQRTQVRSRKR